MRGGWMGPESSLGGLSRTFGLQHQVGRGQEPSIRIERARPGRVAAYLLPYWRQWIVIFLCIAASAGVGVLPPQCVRGILDRAIPERDPHLLYLLVGAIVGLNVTSGLIGVLQNWINARVGQGIVFDLRNQLYRHLQQMSLGFYTTTRAGEIVSRVNNDVAAVQGVATATLIAIVSNVLTVVATVSVLFAMNWRLALLAITIVPTFFLPTRIVGRVRHRLSRETQERQADLLAFMQERLHLGGMLLTRIFGQAESDAHTFQQANREVMELTVRQAMAGRWLFMCLSVFSVTGPALIYGYGGYQAIHQQLSVGTLIAFVAYLTNLYRPIAQLANVYVDVQGALAVFERIFEYLDLRPEVTDRPGAVELDTVQGHIRFERVSFVYPEQEEGGLGNRRWGTGRRETAGGDQEARNGPSGGAAISSSPVYDPQIPAPEGFALREVSFEVWPGERVALVGPSGAGKTTVTYLLPRFFDPTEGRITLDGHDLRDLKQDSLRAHIGMVTQETFLFHATVRENLLYARPEADEAQMIEAARAAQIHDFILSLPQGYDTMVGERGFRLSGGERQRLAIARALLKDPRILILDEATSNLDATSEHLIQQALEALLRGRTAFIIAHRLSTILHADQILVLERGRLVESGRHTELLERNGLYATLYRQQFRRVMESARTA